MATSSFVIEVEAEADGRWIAEVVALSGVMAYGPTREDAVTKVEILALRVLATASNTAKRFPRSRACSERRERLAGKEGASRLGRATTHRPDL